MYFKYSCHSSITYKNQIVDATKRFIVLETCGDDEDATEPGSAELSQWILNGPQYVMFCMFLLN